MTDLQTQATGKSAALPRLIRVLLVDDHELVREGLHLLLRQAPDIVTVGEASDGIAAVELAGQLKPDVVVLDLSMPGGDGESALRQLRERWPGVRVLILTGYSESDWLLPMLGAGASGFLTKDAAGQELVHAIRQVAEGEVYVRPAGARRAAAPAALPAPSRMAKLRFLELSGREQSVVRMVANGFSGVEIANTLGISTKTVDAYKHRIHEKLGFTHRSDYVKFGLEAGLLDG